jgi:hypothetical protein
MINMLLLVTNAVVFRDVWVAPLTFFHGDTKIIVQDLSDTAIASSQILFNSLLTKRTTIRRHIV